MFTCGDKQPYGDANINEYLKKKRYACDKFTETGHFSKLSGAIEPDN